MKNSYNIKVFNAAMVFVVYLTALYSCANGQSAQRISERGGEISYGLHQLTFTGNKWTSLAPMTRGISLGYYFGNNLVKARLKGLGFFQSVDESPFNYLQYEAEALIDFYPLEFLRTRRNIIDIYLFTGVNYSHLTMTDASVPSKNSLAQVTGLGLECIARSDHRMIRFFSEIGVGTRLTLRETDETPESTLSSCVTSINVGLRYGIKKVVKEKLLSY